MVGREGNRTGKKSSGVITNGLCSVAWLRSATQQYGYEREISIIDNCVCFKSGTLDVETYQYCLLQLVVLINATMYSVFLLFYFFLYYLHYTSLLPVHFLENGCKGESLFSRMLSSFFSPLIKKLIGKVKNWGIKHFSSYMKGGGAETTRIIPNLE